MDIIKFFLKSDFPLMLICASMATFFAILFLQSGLDKLFNWKGNLDWLTSHFSKTFLKNSVPFMLGVVTLLEVLAGLCSFLGILEIFIFHRPLFALFGAIFSAMVLVMLFFGQRIAQDYEGAANLVPYFILSIIAMLVFYVISSLASTFSPSLLH